MVWNASDARYPKTNVKDKTQEAIDLLFLTKPVKGRQARTSTGTLRMRFSKRRTHGIIFNSIGKGLLLLRFAQLEPERRAVGKTITLGSNGFDELAAALREAYPMKIPFNPTTNIRLLEAMRQEPELPIQYT